MSNLDQKKRETVLEILRLKKKMDEMKKTYEKLEEFLITNMKLGEEIVTKIGGVDMSETTRQFVDAQALSKILPFKNFVECVTVNLTGVKRFLSLDELADIAEKKKYDRLNVVLKKEPTEETK